MLGLKRDYRQVKAGLWRIKIAAGKYKRLVMSMFFPAIIIYSIFLVACQSYTPVDLQLYATDAPYPYVTSSTPTASENYFGESLEEGFSTSLNLRNCTLLKRFEIGLVKDGVGGDEGFNVLQAIFEEINQAYTSANSVDGFVLSAKNFDSNKDLDNFVNSQAYYDDALCFAIGWNEFSKEENKFAVNLRWNYGEILPPRLPQTDYEEAKQNQVYLNQYAHTGFLQTMTTVTNKILSEVYGVTKFDIKMMYMPMDSLASFHNDGFSEVIGALVPITIYAFVELSSRIIKLSGGTNEWEINLWLQRIGMRKSAELGLEYILSIPILAISLPIIVWTAQSYLVPNISFGFLLVNFIIYAVSSITQSHLIKFTIENHFWAELVEITLELVAVLITIQGYFLTKIYPWYTYTSSALLPIPALGSMMRLGQIAFNYGQSVELFQNNDIVNGNDMTFVMQLALLQMSVKLVLMLYLWPFKINNTLKGDRGPCYLFTISFWRSCCSKQTEHIDEDSRQIEDEFAPLNSLLSNDNIQDGFVLLNLTDGEKDLNSKDLYEAPKNLDDEKKFMQLDRLSVEFGGKHLVNDFSLTIFDGEIFSLIGENGAGKTGLMFTIAGMVHLHGGTAFAYGLDLTKAVRFQTKNFMAWSLDNEILLEEFSPEEHIVYVCRMMGINDIQGTVNRVLNEYGLYKVKDINVNRCSKTQRKKLSVALSLSIGDAKVVMLDDPTGGMDIASKRAMWEIIKRHKKSRIIIIATQDMQEVQAVSDRIGLVVHGKLKMCGSPEYFAKKFQHSIQLVFSLKNSNEAQTENNYKELKESVELAINSQYKDAVSIKWNKFKQLVVKLPIEIRDQDLCDCINMEELQYLQGDLYESLQVGKTSLNETFGEIIKFHHEDENVPESHESLFEQPNVVEARELTISWWRSTFSLITTYFSFKSLWRPMTKLCLITSIVLLQETLFITFFFTLVNENVSNLTAIEEVFEENNPPVLVFANSKLPTGTDITDFFDYYSEKMNEEVEQVDLQQFDDVPTVDPNEVQEIMKEAAEIYKEQAEIFEEEGEEAFASYYVYELDEQENSYSIGVYGNQVAAASCTVFGATMLQTVAQKITGEQTLSIEFRNDVLPINHAYFPMYNPTIAEVYGVSITTALVVLMRQVIIWHGKPVNSGFHDAVITNGGYKSGYAIVKYLKGVLAHIMVVAIIVLVIYGRGFRLPGNVPIFIIFILTNPLFLISASTFFTLRTNMSYKIAQNSIDMIVAIVTVIAIVTAGTIALSQGQSSILLSGGITYLLKPMPFYIFLESIETGFLYVLTQVLNNQDQTVMSKNPLDKDQSYIYRAYFWFGMSIIYWLFYLWFGMKRSLRCYKCRMVRVQPLTEAQINLEDENVKRETNQVSSLVREQQNVDYIVLVDQLQCCKILKQQDLAGKKTDQILNNPNIVQTSKYTFGYFNVKSISFSIQKYEKFVLLGGCNSGSTAIIETMLGLTKSISGEIVVDGKRLDHIYKDYGILHGIIGYQPQQNSIDEELTIRQHIDLFAKLGGITENQRKNEVDQMIDACQLQEFENSQAQTLSHGMVRRLTLGMALIGKPKLVILDNPLDGVDPECKLKLIETIQRYTKHCGLLLATRDVEIAQLLGQRIAVLNQGSMVAIGSVGEIIARHSKGYYAEVHTDMDRIIQQASTFDFSDSPVIENISSAIEILKRLQSTLEEQGVEVSCFFADEFNENGILKAIFNKFQDLEIYLMKEFVQEVLVQNLALILHGEQLEQYPNEDIQIASIQSDRILYTIELKEGSTFDLQYFTRTISIKSQSLPVSYFSVSNTNLDVVFAKLLSEEKFDSKLLQSRHTMRRKTVASSAIND